MYKKTRDSATNYKRLLTIFFIMTLKKFLIIYLLTLYKVDQRDLCKNLSHF